VATILELKQAIAGVLGLANGVSDLTVNGLDLGLMALNAVRLQAEHGNDFEFQRKLLSLSVNTVTGGSLDDVVEYGTATAASIKTLIDVGQLDLYNNMCPVEWTTTAESLERMRTDNNFRRPRYPSDAEVSRWAHGGRRVTFSGNRVSFFPKAETAESVTLVFEAYCYSSDWTATSNTVTVSGGTGVTAVNTTYYRHGTYNGKPLYVNFSESSAPAALYFLWYSGTAWVINQLPGTLGSNYHSLTSTSQSPAGSYTGTGTYTGTAVAAAADADSTSDIWTTKGYNYLLWASVVWLNHNDTTGKVFVPRTEGNLPPPQALADAALATFIANDTNKFELFRRHGR